MFGPTSRYYALPVAKYDTGDGVKVAYITRRTVPQPESLALVQLHSVTEGDRLDNLAAGYVGDPEQFWRIADANAALDPFELTDTVGRKLRITLPEGVPGLRNG